MKRNDPAITQIRGQLEWKLNLHRLICQLANITGGSQHYYRDNADQWQSSSQLRIIRKYKYL